MNKKYELAILEDMHLEDILGIETNVLLVNIDRLKKDSYIDSNASDDTIRVAALYIQDVIIKRVVGRCLYRSLAAMVCHDTISDKLNCMYKLLMDEYLFKIFAYGVPAEIAIPLSFKIRNAGVIQNNSSELTQSGLNDIKYLNQYYNNKKDYYIHEAICFLKEHRDKFCELKNCECSWCGCDKGGLKQSYTTPLNLKKSWIAPQKRRWR